MIFFEYVYRWWAIGKTYYPIGGMQKIADTIKQIALDNSCVILVNTKVNEIITENKKVQGIKTKNGDIYYADKYYAVTALMPIPYEYSNSWNTFGTKKRKKEYYKLKNEVQNILLNRICEKLGDDNKNSITYAELGTPLTFERYTNSTKGSFMGFAYEQKNYRKFLNQKTEIPGLYLVGQWTFPGFGIAGVMASGYYLAKELLKKDAIDLEKEYIEYYINL